MDEESFVRQRRNIIIVSLTLLFVQGTGITLTELSILGNKAALANPLPLEPVLWIAWVYLLLRYWQAYNEYDKPKFHNIFAERVHSDMLGFVLANLKTAPFPSQLPEGASQANRLNVSINSVGVHGWLTAEADLRHLFRTSQDKHRFYDVSQDATWTLPKTTVFRARLAALSAISVSSSLISEVYLPFAIAAVPVCYAAYHFVWQYPRTGT